MKNRKFKIEIKIPIVKKKKTPTGYTIPMRFHIKGMMTLIERSFPEQWQRDMLKEYAKYYVMNLAGAETYPLEK